MRRVTGCPLARPIASGHWDENGCSSRIFSADVPTNLCSPVRGGRREAYPGLGSPGLLGVVSADRGSDFVSAVLSFRAARAHSLPPRNYHGCARERGGTASTKPALRRGGTG